MSLTCKASIGSELQLALDEFQSDARLFDSSYDYKSNLHVTIALCKSCFDSHPDFYFLEGPYTPLTIFNECNVLLKASQKKHGGKRSGAGRKKEESTKLVRVPESLADELTKLKDLYKRLDDLDKTEIKDQIQHLICYAEANQPE
ncbi:hypothetical protein EAY39_07480 [Vibrio anguillarum]|uniref:hypothetical protein n=1 Tax=Vibrio anguillarum TaxID=55601 RepID=UPI0018C2CF25|nr:hypothetical protein [Vibrio anguillarum]MBF4340632.1 hypothetical protein [Vibrio anguillarum]